MATAAITIVDPGSSDAHKRELVARLRDAVLPAEDDLRDPKRWFVIAEAVRPEDEPTRGPDRHFAGPDFAARHDHLAGTRRWVRNGS